MILLYLFYCFCDQPFAWASREFLRQKVIGKKVEFAVEYRVDAIKRNFGNVTFNGENLGLAVATAGWAKVKSAEMSRDGASSVSWFMSAFVLFVMGAI